MATETEEAEHTKVQEKSESEENSDKLREEENQRKLDEYVRRMAYRPVKPPCATERTEKLAKPKKSLLLSTYKNFGDVLSPRERRMRLKRLTGEFQTMAPEQFADILKKQRMKEKQIQEAEMKKQDIYYDLLQRLESQSRRQYLNVMVKKFADFISKLATTMTIPKPLVEPYARMQRGIYCNILTAIGSRPHDELHAMPPPNSKDANAYELCEKLSHALLSMIIKALDAAAKMDPKTIQIEPMEENDWDIYIKERLMCAAEKKCNVKKPCLKRCTKSDRFVKLARKCDNFDDCSQFN